MANLNTRAQQIKQVAGLLALWERDRLGSLGLDGEPADPGRVHAILLDRRHEIARALEKLAPLPLSGMPRPLAIFCYLMFAREDEARATSFFVELAGELVQGAPRAEASEVARQGSAAYRLARRIERARGRGEVPLAQQEIAALCFKAWLFYRIGLHTHLLKVSPKERWWDLGREPVAPVAEAAP